MYVCVCVCEWIFTVRKRKGNVFTSVCQEFCPWWGCTPPWEDNPPSADTSRADTPPEQTPPPPSRRLLQQTVRILLECILVRSLIDSDCFLLWSNNSKVLVVGWGGRLLFLPNLYTKHEWSCLKSDTFNNGSRMWLGEGEGYKFLESNICRGKWCRWFYLNFR